MSKTLLAGVAILAFAAGSAAFAQQAAPAAPAAAAAKLTTKSAIKDIMANPKAREVLAKYAQQVAEFFASGQADSVVPGETPLADIAQFPQAQEAGLTPENLKKIDEDLAKL